MDDTTRGLGDERTRGLVDDDSTAVTPSTATPASRSTTGRSRSRTQKTSTAAAGSSGLDPETDHRTRQIQAEIQHTREEMAETVDALQERLRPSNVIANATERVKTATTTKVRNMAETASDTAQDVMRETRDRASDVVDGVRQNPIPALMIGAGVAWLLMGKSKSRDETRNYRVSRGSTRYSSAYDSGEHSNRETEPVYGDVDYRTSGIRSAGRTGELDNIADKTRSMAHEGYESARRATYRAQNGLQRVLRDNPLLVGAAAVVVGAAVGAALPETERENELMGEARDSVVDRAQDVARTAATTVQEVAKDAADEVAERVVGSGPIGNTSRTSGGTGI